ncbi:hypothetical protein ASG42_28160 [Rhizobium sp. Leaf391]|uniref:glycosyltransferase family 2 protein n=1 Tax=Rhizobium sp. Leaf391 TaxID=1736360 RepID=UPI00071234C4|nr:glycosyltransferase [Rhizobium sp. Leaf391]KQS99306.1 hypothetical protein ASG42_28160 [Rhizobium sp. Leaf391]
MPTISCVLPVFNGEKYLEDAISSILRQDFTDFELILVDDGSVDNSLSIAKMFADNDSRVRIFPRQNSGLIATLNFAIGQANGSYIARMDADDVAHPHRFGTQLEFLSRNSGCVVVGSRVNVIDENGRRVRVSKSNIWRRDERFPSGGITICHPTTMFRLSAFRQTRGYRNEFFAAEDYQLWYEMSEHGYIWEMDDVLLDYRVHSESVSTTKIRDQRLSCVKSDLIYFGKKKNSNPEEIEKIEKSRDFSELLQCLSNSKTLPSAEEVEIYYVSQLLRRVALRGSALEAMKLIFTLLKTLAKNLLNIGKRGFFSLFKFAFVEIIRASVNILRVHF